MRLPVVQVRHHGAINSPDGGVRVSTAEQLRDLLPDATLRLTRTTADVRTTGSTVTAFLKH